MPKKEKGIATRHEYIQAYHLKIKLNMKTVLQVLPFLLRRNKEDVLQDLPPKITQDYYCDLSPLQRILYEDFRSRHSANLISSTSGSSSSNDPPTGHVFEALRYLRNVCNHPKLVLSQRHPLYQTVRIQYRKEK